MQVTGVEGIQGYARQDFWRWWSEDDGIGVCAVFLEVMLQFVSIGNADIKELILGVFKHFHDVPEHVGVDLVLPSQIGTSPEMVEEGIGGNGGDDNCT